MRLSKRTIVIVLATAAVLLAGGIAMRGQISDLHSRVFHAVHGH